MLGRQDKKISFSRHPSTKIGKCSNSIEQVPAGAEGLGGSGEPAVDLAAGLTSETLQPLLSNPEFLEKVKEFLPKDEKVTFVFIILIYISKVSLN